MKSIIAIGAAAFLLGASGVAVAQDSGGGMQTLRAACADDVAKLCPDAKDGKDRHQCMMQHADQVSEKCKTAAAAMREKRQEMMASPGQR